MKRFTQRIRKAFDIFFVRRMYVITQIDNGVKYYYKGADSKWTPIFEGAKHYKKKPDFDWISELWHKVEEYDALLGVVASEKEQKVLICNNCKNIWIAPKDRCDCGCTILTETHPSNYKYARNYA